MHTEKDDGTRLIFRCSQAEKSAWTKLAEESGLTLSSLIRLALNERLVVENSSPGGDDADPRPSDLGGDDGDGLIPFSKRCRLAPHHWMLPPGESCPVCGGTRA